jgi:IclR family acetate operon transcriptional repressor
MKPARPGPVDRPPEGPSSGGAPPGPSAGRYAVAVVDKALRLLEALAEKEALSLAEAALLAGVSKSSAFRLLATLEGAGFAERLPHGGYRAGGGAVGWAGRLLGRLDERTLARPILERLREETGETVNLALLRRDRLVYVEILESPAALRIADVAGDPAPLHATALGKAVAAHLPEGRLAPLLGPEPYARLTDKTITSWKKLRSQLARARECGFASEVEESLPGAACVAAAIVAGDRVLGGVSVTGPRARLDAARIAACGARVRSAAAEIAARLARSGT